MTNLLFCRGSSGTLTIPTLNSSSYLQIIDNDLNTKVTTLNGKLDAIIDNTANITLDTSNIELNTDGLETLITSTNTKLDTIETSVDAVTTSTNAINTTLGTTNTSLTTINTSVGTVNTSVGTVNTTLSTTINDNITDVKTSVDAINTSLGNQLNVRRTYNNTGSYGNVCNNVSILTGAVNATPLDVSLYYDNCTLFYQDSDFNNTGGVVVEVSPDSSNYHTHSLLLPSDNYNDTLRTATLSLNLNGLTDLRIRNASGGTYSNVYCSVFN